MGLFLLRFWPVLLPLLVYALWMKKSRRPLREGPWFWALVTSLGVAVVMFLLLGLSHESNQGAYTPPHMENGQIVPGQVAP